MKRMYQGLALFSTLLVASGAHSQDVGFSQFYDQPLLRNPALAGIFTGDVRFTASYRNQWQSVTIPYRTFGLSGEVKMPVNFVEDDNVTFGLQLLRDVAGTSQFSTTHIMPAINYSLPLSEDNNSYLSIGFMGGLMQQRFDPTKLVLGDQFIAGSNGTFSVAPASRQVFNNTSVNYADLSAGLSYSGGLRDETNYYIGAGIFHITQPNVGFFEGNKIVLNKKLALNAGLSLPTGDNDQFMFFGDYFRQFTDGFHSAGSTFQAGMMYNHDLYVLGDVQNTISFGALYRLDDAIIPVVRLQVSKCIIGASYDVNISKLVVASNYRGGFELTISYRDFLNYNNSERRQVRCLKF
ncbi:MAG: PorP/SprF family type IX secretion system membrane protein [Bacteroidetes bacterium]|nr:PorP/SprF family type IX secretion system membrane protein [Bacteroidota bacterium]